MRSWFYSLSRYFLIFTITSTTITSTCSGGVLIFTVNSLLYLNQSVPAYGASLNSLTKDSTSFPLSKYFAISKYLNLILVYKLALCRVSLCH